jgi:hypothetical protein
MQVANEEVFMQMILPNGETVFMRRDVFKRFSRYVTQILTNAMIADELPIDAKIVRPTGMLQETHKHWNAILTFQEGMRLDFAENRVRCSACLKPFSAGDTVTMSADGPHAMEWTHHPFCL